MAVREDKVGNQEADLWEDQRGYQQEAEKKRTRRRTRRRIAGGLAMLLFFQHNR